MKGNDLRYLTESERAALEEFVARLRERYAEEVVHVILFGSKVRGDFDEESDLDLLVVVKSGDWRFHDQVSCLALEPMIEHNVVLSALTVGQGFYEKMGRIRTPFYENLVEEGVELWPPAQGIRQPSRPSDKEAGAMEAAVKENIDRYLALSRDELDTAGLMLKNGKYRASLSRAYYAVFYAASALLLSKGIRRSKHSGVEAAFNRYFVKPGLLEPEYSKIYRDSRKAGELSDYELAFMPAEKLVETRLAEAKRFVARVEEYLRAEGGDGPVPP